MKTNIIVPIDQKQKDTGTEDLMTRHKTQFDKHRQKCIKEQQKATKNHTVFCYPCAIEDAREQQRTQWLRKGTTLGKTQEDIPININLKPYTDPKRFTFIKETEIIEPKLIDGLRQNVQTGIYKEYKCKIDLRHKLSTQHPIPHKQIK